jgi:hypothetical protein
MRRIGLSMLGMLFAGCGPTVTDTGYEPHRLGMSDSQRKALYAPQYSPEKAQANSAQQQQGASGGGGRRVGAAGAGLGPAN